MGHLNTRKKPQIQGKKLKLPFRVVKVFFVRLVLAIVFWPRLRSESSGVLLAHNKMYPHDQANANQLLFIFSQ